MAITKRVMQVTVMAAGVIGVAATTAPDSAVGRFGRRVAHRLNRDVRYAVGTAPGILYRLAGRRPDPDVADDVLADRIRSSLGPLEKRLDVPRVHVLVDDHVAILHGEVPNDHHRRAIEHAVMRISGVTGIESHLHTGLASGDTRPSQGAAVPQPPSDALRTLLDAAREAGAGRYPRPAVHAVLCGFTDRLPEDERAQVFTHLPADVRALAGPVHRIGERPPRLRTLPQLVAAVTAEGGIDAEHAEDITRAVIATLRGIVRDEARDVAAVLPGELRELWETEPTP